MTNILYVEDDDIIRDNFTELLTDEGFVVSSCRDIQSALDLYMQKVFDIALLDIRLGPDKDGGFFLCSEIRKHSPILPIIFFTSLGSDFDKISGMRLGADDYITKDTSLEYIVVRIRALLRRIEAFQNKITPVLQSSNDIMLDIDSCLAQWRGQAVNISLTQFWILHELMNHSGKVKSHIELMNAAKIVVEPNTIAAHIKKIREEFRKIDPNFDAIKTVRSGGYRWSPEITLSDLK